jgi:hypothetical protein
LGTNFKGRGRKSFLSKSQSQAVVDVVAVTQLSITRELREIPTPEGVSK